MIITYAEICSNIPLDIEEMKETIKALHLNIDDIKDQRKYLAKELTKYSDKSIEYWIAEAERETVYTNDESF